MTVSLEGGDTIEADLLLVAVGRGPVTDGLGYEEAGVTIDRGFVLTDERCRTNVDGVYRRRRHRPRPAARAPRLRAGHLRRRGDRRARLRRPIDELGIPRVTYCDPEIASVGLTEAQAREPYGEVETYEYNLGGNGKSPDPAAPRASSSWCGEKDGPVVGVHMIGARMGEQVGEAQLIVNWEALPADVARSSTPTRPRTRPSARRTWPWPGSRCTPTPDANPGRRAT